MTGDFSMATVELIHSHVWNKAARPTINTFLFHESLFKLEYLALNTCQRGSSKYITVKMQMNQKTSLKFCLTMRKCSVSDLSPAFFWLSLAHFPTKPRFPIWLVCYWTHQKQSGGETVKHEDRLTAIWRWEQAWLCCDIFNYSNWCWSHFLSCHTQRSWWMLMRHSGSECCLITHSEKILCGLIPSGQPFFSHEIKSLPLFPSFHRVWKHPIRIHTCFLHHSPSKTTAHY